MNVRETTDRIAAHRGRTPRRCLAAALLLVAAPALHAQFTGMSEADCLAVLKSDAELKAKADACRELVRSGTAQAVPVLAGLLADDKLSHSARYALEPIPDAAVDVALRDALGRLSGKLRVGVIGSIGTRRDAAAIPALAALLGDADAETAGAAARALGRMGTPAAADALEAAIAKAPANAGADLAEGLFRCAERLAADGSRARAAEMYNRLRTRPDTPQAIALAALRGQALALGETAGPGKMTGIDLLLRALRDPNYAYVCAAARTAQEMPEPAVTKALADALPGLNGSTQMLIALTLSKRGDQAASPTLVALAQKVDADSVARIAAIRALTELGEASAAPSLLKLQSDHDADVAEAARRALGALEGPEIDAALLEMLSSQEAGPRLIAIDMLARRRPDNALPAMLKAAKDADAGVRTAAIKALGAMAGKGELPAMIELLVKGATDADRKAAEDALCAVCTRLARPDAASVVIRRALYGDLPDGKQKDVSADVMRMLKNGVFQFAVSNANFGDPAAGTRKRMTLEYVVHGMEVSQTVAEGETLEIKAGTAPPAVADAIRGALAGAGGGAKPALLRVLRAAGGGKALAAVTAALNDGDATVASTAVDVVASWPTPEALPELMRLAKAARDDRTKVLALRGCYRLIALQNVPESRKIAEVKDALALSERADEKRLAFATLASIATTESLSLVLPYLGEPAVAEEAALAAVGIAEKLPESAGAAVSDAAKQVLKTAKTAATRRRAKALVK